MISKINKKFPQICKVRHIHQIRLIKILDGLSMWLQALKYALSLGYLYPQFYKRKPSTHREGG